MAEQKQDPWRGVDDDARALARRLMRTARFAAIATLNPENGWPQATRVAVAADSAGLPLILISNLAAHTPALKANPRCTLLFGEPGSGDPLAHPRISVAGIAKFIPRASEEEKLPKARFLARNPQAASYAELSDFHLVRIDVDSASLNGGFTKAYRLAVEDVVDAPVDPALQAAILRALTHMNSDHLDAVDTLARRSGAETEGWRILSGDRRGFEIGRRDEIRRLEFLEPVTTGEQLHLAYVNLLNAG